MRDQYRNTKNASGALLTAALLIAMAGTAWAAAAAPTKSASSARGEGLTLVTSARTDYRIVVGDEASPMVRDAANALAEDLLASTGADFPVISLSDAAEGGPWIAVGPEAARYVQPDLNLDHAQLGDEGIVIRTAERNLILTGAEGERRGTAYAAFTFLQDYLGFRWWSQQEKLTPRHDTLTIPTMDRRYRPILEYREVHTSQAFDSEWSLRNRCNGQDSQVPDELGGHIRYVGPAFVHTFDLLVDPATHFAQHPEWFSEIDGQRVAPPGQSQWCLTNEALLDHVIELSRDILRTQAGQDRVILSISPNDWDNPCQCAPCLAVEEEEGSSAGPLLRFVNAIADAVADEFPYATIDTLAYRYTRTAPRVTKARPNVIIRLATFGASFATPLDSPQNRAFTNDLLAWSKVCPRLYVWDYIVNFRHYVHPHPNLHVLSPNTRFLVDHNVRGVFSQSNRHDTAGDFKILRGWVMAQLLWDPSLDGDALVRQFIEEYYGPAGPAIGQYAQLLRDAVTRTNHYMGLSDNALAPYLTPQLLDKADHLLRDATAAVGDDAMLLRRVELVHASALHAIINGWAIRQQVAAMNDAPWPLERTLQNYADQFVRIARDHGITRLSEAGDEGDIADWAADMARRGQPVKPSALLSSVPRDRWFAFPADSFSLYGEEAGNVARVADPQASSGHTARMPANHREWSVQMEMIDLPIVLARDERWVAYAAIRVEAADGASQNESAFTAGVYDPATETHIITAKTFTIGDVKGDAYQLYRIGPTPLGSQIHVWIAPAIDPSGRRAINVDQIVLMREQR